MTVLFAAAALASLGIVWTVQALTKINLVTDTGQSIGAFLKLASLLLPVVVPIILPFAVLIGITQSLATMNTNSETAVIAASGSRRSVIFRPAFLLSGLAALLLAFVSHVVEPYSRQAVRTLVANANADLLTLAIQEGSFKRVDENLYVQIAERKPDGQLGGVFIADSRDPAADLIYYAKTGVVEKQDGISLLYLNDGEFHRRGSGDGSISLVKFNSYAFDLSEFSAAAGGVRLLPKDRGTAYLLNPDKNDPIFLDVPQHFTAALHKRFTVWLYPIVFAFISLAVIGAVRSHREMRLNPTFAAASLAMAARWVGLFNEDLAERSMAGVYGMYIVPILTIVLATWHIHRQRELRQNTLWRRYAEPVLAGAAGAARRFQVSVARRIPALSRTHN